MKLDQVINVKSMSLQQKLAQIREICQVVQEDSKGYGYTYASIEEILAKVSAGMNKYHVSLIPRMEEGSVVPDRYKNQQFAKNGQVVETTVGEMFYSGKMIYTWIDDDNPESKIEVPWFVFGSQKDPSQAMGSALTYGLRYFLLQYFQIATPEDDPDAWRSKQMEAEKEKDKRMATEILNELHEFVLSSLKENPDKRPAVLKTVQKYARFKGKPSDNYFVITDPNVASELFSELRVVFGAKIEEKGK